MSTTPRVLRQMRQAPISLSRATSGEATTSPELMLRAATRTLARMPRA
jgi:hypothetical protein